MSSIVNLSYPKPRSTQSKVFAVARADNATQKCWLPKDAVILGVYVIQMVACSTAVSTFDIGLGTDVDGILNDFQMGTTSVGYAVGGAACGVAVGTKLTADSVVTSTYTVGSSTAGGTGFVKIEYFVPGPGEAVDD